MQRFVMRAAVCVALASSGLYVTHAVLSGQAPAQAPAPLVPPGELVIGAGSYSPIVGDVDKTLAFYRDVIGLQVPDSPQWGTGQFIEPSYLNFFGGAPGQEIRQTTVRLPGSTVGVEMIEFRKIERKPVQPRVQDPGTVRLVLLVRDLDSIVARVKQTATPIVTTGGAPVLLADKSRAIVVNDPDGRPVQLLQTDPLPETTAPDTSNVIGVREAITVAETDQTIQMFRDLLGYAPQVGTSFMRDETLAKLYGTPGAQMRTSTAIVPGSAVRVEFIEFKGVDRKPLRTNIQDPGSTRLQIRVKDAAQMVKVLKSAGGTVVTAGGDAIEMRGLHVAIVRDLNGVFLVAVQPAPPGQGGQRGGAPGAPAGTPPPAGRQ